jgi:hypothetical protein
MDGICKICMADTAQQQLTLISAPAGYLEACSTAGTHAGSAQEAQAKGAGSRWQ